MQQTSKINCQPAVLPEESKSQKDQVTMQMQTSVQIISASKDTNKPNSSNLQNFNFTKKLPFKFLRLQNRFFTGIELNSQRQKTLERLFIFHNGATPIKHPL